MKRVQAYVIGVGPSSPEWISPAVLSAIQLSEIIVGWQMDLNPVFESLKGKKVRIQTITDYQQVLQTAANEALLTNATLAVLKTGDPLIAPAGISGVLQTLVDFDVKIIPGISTVQLAAARIPISLIGCQIITYHPTPHDGGRDLRLKRCRMLSAIDQGRNLFILTGVRQLPRQTAGFLIGAGVDPNISCVVCEKLSQVDERITRCSLSDVAEHDFTWQSVLVVITNP